jgi:hypothetical protein
MVGHGAHREEKEGLIPLYIQDDKPIVPGGLQYVYPTLMIFVVVLLSLNDPYLSFQQGHLVFL